MPTNGGNFVMFIYAFRASTVKFFSAIFAFVLALTLAVILIPQSSQSVLDSAYLNEGLLQTSAKNEGEILRFLGQFGWETEEKPCDTARVVIPQEFDRVFSTYNNLQMRQGFDLSNYKNKEVTRYTYRVTNYPDYEATVYANVFVYKDKIIGGDICSAAVNGFLHGFELPQNSTN
jgi:hypothetical protein